HRLFDRISGVILMSPDIDLDVFRAQARAIGPLPQPFVIFVSRRDRALALSARLTGQRERLGNIGTPEAVAEFDVTLVDVSAFAGGGGLNHFAVGNSPELIRLLNRLPEVDNAFQSGRSVRPGLLPGTIMSVQNATEVILSPLVQIAN
ncbi:MAG: alpha/beta hydrolase, partial [Rhodobacteraceae bacterium]